MSGSGGGGGTPDTQQSDCASLLIRTSLNSPVPRVLKKLKTGDALIVRLRPPEQRVVEAITPDGDTAGSITHASVATLARCLRDGFEFVAIVKHIDDGDCRVEIRPAAQ